MSRTRRQHFPDVEHVEAVAAGVAADDRAPGGEWYVRMGTVWEADHPVVQAHPAWFVEFGRGTTSAPFFPEREPAS
jgi:hypothetical protein